MIRKLEKNDRETILKILTDTHHFNDEEIKVAMELVDIYLNDANQKDYIIYVYVKDSSDKAEGYICYGKRPLTDWTYDLYWIAVDPNIHGKGIGSGLVKHMEEDLKAIQDMAMSSLFHQTGIIQLQNPIQQLANLS